MAESEHIVHKYDEDLSRLDNLIAEMGGLAETQLADAIQALVRFDAEEARRIVEEDKKIDELESEIDEFTVKLVALRQPMAADLRVIITGLKIASNLERIGDYAKNLAKRAIVLNQFPPAETIGGVVRMGALVRQRFKEVLDAYANKDVPLAVAVWEGDAEIDQHYNSLFRELLTYMMEDPRTITVGTHLLFIAKNLERIGDLATNIAEQVHFQVSGTRLDDDRPKSDDTPMLASPNGDVSDAG